MPANIHRCRLLLITSLVVLGLAGSTLGQATEAPDGDSVRSASPRVIADPAQPPGGLSSDAWGKILRQARAARYDLARQAGTAGNAEDAVWVAPPLPSAATASPCSRQLGIHALL